MKKVEGKGLSTNDFTNELKEKLEDITPYDPSELEAEIGKLETALNTLVGGNASNAIESFNEIIAFLEGKSFIDVIRTAVSLGGDCDTLTCITGSVAEAFYGIPEELKRKAATETGGQVGTCQLSFTGICEECLNRNSEETA